jgi:hypothetical protein
MKSPLCVHFDGVEVTAVGEIQVTAVGEIQVTAVGERAYCAIWNRNARAGAHYTPALESWLKV